MHRRKGSPGNGTAAAVGILLIGTALAAAWLLVAPWLLGGGRPSRYAGPSNTPSTIQAPQAQAAALLPGVKIAESQLSQPRDPFRPLLGPTDTTPGNGGNEDLRVRLVEVRTVAGVERVTVIVDGQSYDVGVGESFAGNFKLVSIDSDSAVFLFGDNAFELLEGQEVLK